MLEDIRLNLVMMRRLSELTELALPDLEVLLMIAVEGSMATPSICKTLGIRSSTVNCRIGPRLCDSGWITGEKAKHERHDGKPTVRWTMSVEDRALLTKFLNKATIRGRDSLVGACSYDHRWVPNADAETVE